MMSASASAAVTSTGAIAFSDIVGFTELTADHGDELALALVEQHEAIVEAALAGRGRIVKQLGDGLLLFFDDARDAVATMVEIHDACADVETLGVPLWLRSGVHWGSPRRRGDDLIGHDVNLASRISAIAAPGELLVTEALLEQLDTQRDGFRRVGPVFVKGVSEPVALWRAAQ